MRSSITELGLTIFTASLAALRPLIKMIKWGKTEISGYGNSGYGQSGNKRSQRSRPDMGPSIRLDDVQSKASTTGSQEYIVPRDGVGKKTEYTVTYTEA